MSISRCSSCYGCGKMEHREYQEVLECSGYQPLREELDKRVKEAESKLVDWKQVKL